MKHLPLLLALMVLLTLGGSRPALALGMAGNEIPGAPPPACALGQLRVTVVLPGKTIGTFAAGAVGGSIGVSLKRAGTCRLSGRPRVQLLDVQHRPLRVTQQRAGGTATLPPSVTIRRAGRQTRGAVASLEWRNWCGGTVAGPLSLRMRLPGAGAGSFPIRALGEPVPRCVNRSAPSVLLVGAFKSSPG